MSLIKIRQIPLYFKRLSWEIDFHEMTLMPFLMIFVNCIYMTISLSSLEMQLLSYATLAGVLASFIFMLFLFLRNKVVSQYGLLYVLFFIILLGITIINSQDVKDCLYTAISIWLNLMLFRYFHNRTQMLISFFCIALSFCVYLNFIHMITHPSLWLIQTEKEGTGYLLGYNYNQMGCRMLVALISNVICNKFSKLWKLNFYILATVCIVSLLFVGSMTSLSMIAVFVAFCNVPSARLRKIGIISLFAVFALFQTFVVFSGRGLENNELAVYIVEDILNKDLTFTHRTYMWESALKVITQSPIWGYGYVDSDWFTKNMNSFAIGPHNFILSVFIQGGILIFCVYAIICIKSYMRIRQYMHKSIVQKLILATMCLWFMSLMEMYPYTIMMYPLILIYYYQNLEIENNNFH